jgi:hypothetical protein
MREHFAWEYKGEHKDLVAAYQQLQLYREDLENPPHLVVCDLDRLEIHTNFTNTPKQAISASQKEIVRLRGEIEKVIKETLSILEK